MSPSDEKTPQVSVGLETSSLAVPEKAALSNVTTVCDRSPRTSDASTPRSDKLNPFDTDIEAMMPTSTTDSCTHKALANKRKSDCQVWPDKKDWKQRAKASKKKRNNCACLASLSQRNRIIAKILIGLLIIGLAVGVGFGVSKPLNAPIWGDKD